MAIPLLDAIDIQGKEITADALLTQRRLAAYLVTERKAHYHFAVKGNQPGLLQDLTLYFQDRREPHFVEATPPGIMDASKLARSGPPWNSTTTSLQQVGLEAKLDSRPADLSGGKRERAVVVVTHDSRVDAARQRLELAHTQTPEEDLRSALEIAAQSSSELQMARLNVLGLEAAARGSLAGYGPQLEADRFKPAFQSRAAIRPGGGSRRSQKSRPEDYARLVSQQRIKAE